MNCQICLENLTAFLDQELNRAEADGVRSHLDVCAGCRDEMEDLERAGRFVTAGAVALEPRPVLWESVRARVAVAPAPTAAPVPRVVPFFRQGWVRATTLALAASLVMGIGVWDYWVRQENARKLQEAASLERYMNEYVDWRQGQEQAHRSAIAAAAAAEATAPTVVVSGPSGRPVHVRRTHREYTQNPFVNLAEDSSRSLFRPAEVKAPEATK